AGVAPAERSPPDAGPSPERAPFDEPCPLRPASVAGPRPVGSASVWMPPDGLGADITSPLDVGWESSGAATITSGRWSVTVAIGGAGVARATPPNNAAIPSDARNPPVGPLTIRMRPCWTRCISQESDELERSAVA